jgi:putative ABC transport system permease protein
VNLFVLIIRNVFRNKLRSLLTIAAVAMAMSAFCTLTTMVDAWYLGVETSSANRLVTRNKTSLVYTLPVAYKKKILQVSGVSGIGYGHWYGGVYKDKKNYFPQFAVSGLDYLDLFPEFAISETERKLFERERRGCIAGRQVAERFGWKIGDTIPLQGTIYPGNIELVLTGIYKGSRKNVDETAFFFHYDYLNEMLKKTAQDRADKVGWYMVGIKDADRAAEISEEIDALFRSSLAETLTETEKAFQMGFVAMTEAIVASIKIIAVVVIVIILLAVANTMAMTSRERTSEYAVLKTLGFDKWHLFALISGESTAISLIGGMAGVILSFPGSAFFQKQLQGLFPPAETDPTTVVVAIGASFMIGLVAAFLPTIRITRMPIAEGLRHMG